MKKLTQAQMREKLMSLTIGSKIEMSGKVYNVLGVTQHPEMKTCKTSVALLEEGKPETYMTPGKYLAAGKMIEIDNVSRREWYAMNDYMNWELVA